MEITILLIRAKYEPEEQNSKEMSNFLMSKVIVY